MRDRADLCANCGTDFSDAPRAYPDPDICWWCGVAALDEQAMMAMAEYFGATGATAPILQPQTR